MDPDRRTARIVGALFVLATVASILGSIALGSVLDGSNYLIGVADHEASVIVATLLFLVAAASAFGTAFLLFPILRRHAEGLAAGYVGFRAFENVLYATSAVTLLVMLSVSQDEAIRRVAVSDIPLVGAALLALHDWTSAIGTLVFFALGGTILNAVLYRSRLVPRWLSAWGLVGAALAFLYGLIGIFGGEVGVGSPFMLLAMPIAVQEMVFAGWLMIRGFERSEVRLDRTPERLTVPERVEV
jgi:uncharacterized protein DUF4386